jgi:hypothetical protein
MTQKTAVTTADVIHALLGKPCWYVSCGAVGSTFELAFGKKVPRQQLIRNDEHAEEFRRFEGEANLLVWCTWRLDESTRPVTSSDDADEGIFRTLPRLTGAVVADVLVEMPGWDLVIRFSNDLTLRVFCDHVPGDPSFDGNWELWQPDRVIAVGVGSVCEVEPRTT